MTIKSVCKITHRQLLSGECPWCEQDVAPLRHDSALGPGDRDHQRVWNLDVLTLDLDDPELDIRMATVTNLLLHAPPIGESIPLLAKALNDPETQVREHASHAISRLGSDLSEEQAEELESHLDAGEHALTLRLLLVGYYFLKHSRSEKARVARNNHILWLIDNAADCQTCGRPDCSLLKSEDADAYQQAKALWLAKVQENPDNPAIVANAASFFTLADPALSQQLLEQGRDLEPDNPLWHERLGQLYSLRSRAQDAGDKAVAAKGLAAFQQAEQVRQTQQDLPQGNDSDVLALLSRLHALPELARSALDAYEFEQAANYAAELLALANSKDLPEYFRNDGNAVHYGNLVLGLVALGAGDIEAAKLRLLASGQTKGSPNLMSFGPNMSLAKELLERGETEVVLHYFALCRHFWERGSDQLDQWTEDIEQGKIPDFGANLVY